MVAFGMALLFILVVGSAGYVCMPAVLSTSAAAVGALRSDDRVDDSDRETDSDTLVTPAAVMLGLIALLAVVVAANPSRIKDTA